MRERVYTPNQEFYVRDAKHCDARNITDLLFELAMYCGHPSESFGITSGMVAEDITNGGPGKYKLAAKTSDDDPVGMGHYGIIATRSWSGRRGIYLEDLFVQAPYRDGRGIGSLIVGSIALEALALVDTPGQAFVRLDTSGGADNEATLRYYRRQGFDGHNVNFRLSGAALGRFVEQYASQSE